MVWGTVVVFLVLAVVPMGLIGVVGALLLFNRALGFVAILGVLSLAGMIARNAVILIEQIEAERREGTDACLRSLSTSRTPLQSASL